MSLTWKELAEKIDDMTEDEKTQAVKWYDSNDNAIYHFAQLNEVLATKRVSFTEDSILNVKESVPCLIGLEK